MTTQGSGYKVGDTLIVEAGGIINGSTRLEFTLKSSAFNNGNLSTTENALRPSITLSASNAGTNEISNITTITKRKEGINLRYEVYGIDLYNLGLTTNCGDFPDESVSGGDGLDMKVSYSVRNTNNFTQGTNDKIIGNYISAETDNETGSGTGMVAQYDVISEITLTINFTISLPVTVTPGIYSAKKTGGSVTDSWSNAGYGYSSIAIQGPSMLTWNAMNGYGVIVGITTQNHTSGDYNDAEFSINTQRSSPIAEIKEEGLTKI